MTISEQKTALFFRLSISLTVFGALFKFVSWPLITMGALGMVVFHAIQFFQKQHRSALDYSRQLLIIFFLGSYLSSIFNLPYNHVLILLTQVALIAFLLFYIKKIVKSVKDTNQNNFILPNIKTENLSYTLADLATVYIVVASLFKILHWEFGPINSNLLMVIGLFTALISLLAGSKFVRS